MRTFITIILISFVLNFNNSLADIVFFDNGDRLSGDISALVDNKMILNNTNIGDVEIDMDTVKTFSTEEPIDIYYPDGKTEKIVINESVKGKVAVINKENNESRTVEIPDILRLGPPEDAVIWRGNIRSGLSGSSGDSDNLNFNVGINLQRRSLRNRTTFNAEYLLQQSDGDIDENKWFSDLKHDYFFSTFYGFTFFRIEQDEDADLDIRTILSSGLGKQWIERKDLKISTEAGLSWLYEDFGTGMNDNKISARLAYFFEKGFGEKIRFFNDLEFYPRLGDPSDFFLRTTAALRTKVSKAIFSEARVIFEHDSTPAIDTGKNNLTYLYSIGMNF